VEAEVEMDAEGAENLNDEELPDSSSDSNSPEGDMGDDNADAQTEPVDEEDSDGQTEPQEENESVGKVEDSNTSDDAEDSQSTEDAVDASHEEEADSTTDAEPVGEGVSRKIERGPSHTNGPVSADKGSLNRKSVPAPVATDTEQKQSELLVNRIS
jgi:hypothetical protein